MSTSLAFDYTKYALILTLQNSDLSSGGIHLEYGINSREFGGDLIAISGYAALHDRMNAPEGCFQ